MNKEIKDVKWAIFTNILIGSLMLVLKLSFTPIRHYSVPDEAYNSLGYNNFFYVLLILLLSYGGNAFLGVCLGIITAKSSFPVDICGTTKRFIFYCISTLILFVDILIQENSLIIIGQQIVGYILGYGIYDISKYIKKRK